MVIVEIPVQKLYQEIEVIQEHRLGGSMSLYRKGVIDTLEWLIYGGQAPHECGPFQRECPGALEFP